MAEFPDYGINNYVGWGRVPLVCVVVCFLPPSMGQNSGTTVLFIYLFGGEGEKDRFIACPGKGGHSRLMP